MATSAPSTSVSTAARPRVRIAAAVALVAAGAAYAPLLTAYGRELWELPHYQFFPLALAAAAYFGWQRVRAAVAEQPFVPGPAAGLFVLAVIAWGLLAGAIVLESPWLAAVSAWWLVLAAAVGLGGGRLVAALGPSLMLLALAVRLPLNLDLQLVLRLQGCTVWWASGVLDLLKVIHSVDGHVISISDRPLLVEQACSGINSLYSAVACTLLLIVAAGRRFWPAVLLLASVPFWVVLANTGRVVAVAWLNDRWQIPAHEGLWHDALGAAIFIVAMLLVVSFDRLLLFFTPPPRAKGRAAAVGSEAPPRQGSVAVWGLLAVAGLGLALFQAPALERPSAEAAVAGRVLVAVPELPEELLPAEWGAWRRVGFLREQREVDSIFGEFSQRWDFAAEALAAVASLDYPFRGWHELTECYQTQGWEVRSREVLELPAGRGLPARKVVRVELAKPVDGQQGLLVFELLDEQLAPLRPLERGELDEFAWRARRSVEAWRAWARGEPPPAPSGPNRPSAQLQVFLTSYNPLGADDRRLAERLLDETRRRLAGAWRPVAEAAR